MSDGAIEDAARLERGREVFERVYGGVLPSPPAGLMDFADLMLGQLFAEHWDRRELSVHDRRLLTLGAIAAIGDADTWAIHLEAAVRNGELTAVEARETVTHLCQYVGYPRASPLLMRTEQVLAKVAEDDHSARPPSRPAGYGTVTARLVVPDVDAAVQFMRAVFGATGEVDAGRPAELRIGDSLVMVSGAGEREAFPAFLYVYVDDADAVFGRAVEAGAAVIEEPLDTPYGDRRAMVRDPSGNVFQIAHRRQA